MCVYNGNKKPHHDGPVRRHDLKDIKVNHRVYESLVSCHFRYFLLSRFYCHRMILQPGEVPKMSRAYNVQTETESTMISEEHNLQNSRLLSNLTAPGPSGPNLI